MPRTAAGILGPVSRPPGPRTAGKWVTASIAEPAAAVVAAVFAEAGRRDPGHMRTWIALADGNLHQIRRIQAEAAGHGVTVTIICDVIHVIEYLWDAAWSFFDRSKPRRGPVGPRPRRRHPGRPRRRRRRRPPRRAAASLPTARRKAAHKTAAYLDAKAPYLDYPTALGRGWPISSGVIEGTCRHLVKDRMDITGARWSIPTAEAILQLRALHANGDFDAYWAYHLHQEHQRNHGHAHALAA